MPPMPPMPPMQKADPLNEHCGAAAPAAESVSAAASSERGALAPSVAAFFEKAKAQKEKGVDGVSSDGDEASP